MAIFKTANGHKHPPRDVCVLIFTRPDVIKINLL